MKNFVFLLGACLALSACKTTVKSDNPSVEVEVDGGHHGDFCPPGQAKKGNC